ncbi:Uncharacterised protein [Mycobacterium tuberculosis]|nr:Uncharacterised protein [Mycobacterium tuberculosis]
MHLGNDMAQLAVAVVAPEDAQRVEDIAENACLQQRGDTAVGDGKAASGKEGVQPVTQRAMRRTRERVSEVVVGVEPCERSQPPGQLGEVVDIHVPAVAAVCERVVHRDLSAVTDRGAVDRRRQGLSQHATIASCGIAAGQSAPRRRAARRPEAAPSSWNPQPW